MADILKPGATAGNTPAPAATTTIGAPAYVPDPGAFGLNGTRIFIKPGTSLEELFNDARMLLRNALAVFETVDDGNRVPDTHFAGLYLLRQADLVMSALDLTAEQSDAAMAAGWGVQ